MRSVKYLPIILLLLILIMQLFLRLPFLHEPLDVDEGRYAVIGQGVLLGEIPYRDSFDHKPPLVYYIYASIFKLFGQGLIWIRLSALLFGLISTLALFLIGNLLWGRNAGLLAAGTYAVFSGGPLIHGSSSNTESFMVLFIILALLAFLAALKARLPGKISYLFLFASGLFSGLAIMTKQVALFNFLVILGFSFFGINVKRAGDWAKSFCLMLGALITPIFFVVYFGANKALPDFIDFAFKFNLGYVQSGFTPLLLFRTLYIALCENSVVWLLAGAAVSMILFYKRDKLNILVVVWAMAAFLGVTSGGHYFGHYYIQMIPALCLLSGYALAEVRFKKQQLNVLAFALLLFLSFLIIANEYEFYLKYSPEEISMQKYGHPRYVIARDLARSIEKRTGPDDHIFEIGFPQILFYSKRRGPGKYYFIPQQGKCEISLFGRKLYAKRFVYNIDKEYYDKVGADFTRGLRDRRTKYAVFQSHLVLPDDFYKELKSDYKLSGDLSAGLGDVLVYERIKK